MRKYFATNEFLPATYGIDFNTYVWHGIIVENDEHIMARLDGVEAMKAYIEAKENGLYECALTTGAIAAPPGYFRSRTKKKNGRNTKK